MPGRPACVARTLSDLSHLNTLVLRLIEILSIRGDTDEYHDAQREADLKAHANAEEAIRVRYAVHGMAQTVNLWLEYAPSNVHDSFYAQYKQRDFQPPRVVWLVKDEQRRPGEYEVEWDGRDQTTDRRLLLAGRYVAKIEGRLDNDRRASDATELLVAKPMASNFGIHYRKGGSWQSTKKEVEHAASKQQALSDGTAFAAETHLDYEAYTAALDMAAAATVYWSGHSTPAMLVFHHRENVAFRKADGSRLWIRGTGVRDPDASMQEQEPGAFRDLFLIMLNGCRCGNEIMMVEWALSLFNPGSIDSKHGPKTTAALRGFQRIHELEPADGAKNEQTLAWLGISAEGKTERALTREVQARLKRYDPGEPDGVLGRQTRTAIRNYQTDHPDLDVTGEPDPPTLAALQIGKKDSHLFVPRNIAEAMEYRGADITMGFEHKVGFEPAEKWGIDFWDNLAAGDGVNTAASSAQAMVDHRHRRDFDYNIYTQDGVSPESTVHPARYGKIT